MESIKSDIKTPLNKINLRKELADMEEDYDKIKAFIFTYEKDYENTINNISLTNDSTLESKNSMNSLNNFNEMYFIFINNRNAIQENFTIILNSMKDRLTRIKNIYPDEKFENLDNKKILNNINNIYNKAREEFNFLTNRITEKLNIKKDKIFNTSAYDEVKENIYSNLDLAKDYYEKAKVQLLDNIEKGKEQTKTYGSIKDMYYETLKARQEEYKKIFE